MRLHLPSFGTPAASSAASSSSSAAGFAGASTAARGALAALLVFGSSVTNAPSAQALDAAAVGTCVVTQCTAPLARCIVDGSCLANLACIQTCNNRPDEGDCQIKCGDDFSSPAVDQFTKCAVTAKDCVPQRTDDGSWPVPIGDALVKSFDPSTFTGPWYISAGLNKAFDVFDCQLHKFEFQKAAPAKAIKAGGQPQETLPGKLVGDLQWRVKDPVAGTNFVTRKAVQEFWQDAKNPAILYNHDNDFLHYEDDWYILAQKENAYVAVYYRGNNDAWDGYGGRVVYSKDPVLNPKYFPELDAAFQKVGHSWSEFQLTGKSSCKVILQSHLAKSSCFAMRLCKAKLVRLFKAARTHARPWPDGMARLHGWHGWHGWLAPCTAWLGLRAPLSPCALPTTISLCALTILLLLFLFLLLLALS